MTQCREPFEERLGDSRSASRHRAAGRVIAVTGAASLTGKPGTARNRWPDQHRHVGKARPSRDQHPFEQRLCVRYCFSAASGRSKSKNPSASPSTGAKFFLVRASPRRTLSSTVLHAQPHRLAARRERRRQMRQEQRLVGCSAEAISERVRMSAGLSPASATSEDAAIGRNGGQLRQLAVNAAADLLGHHARRADDRVSGAKCHDETFTCAPVPPGSIGVECVGRITPPTGLRIGFVFVFGSHSRRPR